MYSERTKKRDAEFMLIRGKMNVNREAVIMTKEVEKKIAEVTIHEIEMQKLPFLR